LLIFANHRPAYLDALVLADRGDYAEVIEFFRDRGIDTTQLVIESLMTAATPKLGNQASRISRAAKLWRDLSDAELITTGNRIVGKINELFEERAAGLHSQDFSASSQKFKFSVPYEHDSGERVIQMTELMLKGLARKRIDVSARILVFWSPRPHPFPFRIHDYNSVDDLAVRLGDVLPELTPHFLLRLDQWIQRVLARMLNELAQRLNA